MEILMFVLGAIFGACCVFFAMKNAYAKIEDVNSDNSAQLQLLFENIANKIFKENVQDFSNLSKERMNELLEPFKEKIEEIKKKFEINNEKFTTLDVHIKNVMEVENQITKETSNLTKALKSDNMKQGKWGELVLEKVLSLSGLVENREYILQKSSGTGKPDATILLPDNKAIFIDAKTTFNSYYEYINSTNEEEKVHYLKAFKDSIKTHITGLSKREYFANSEFNSPEYVLMFIPIESCYSLIFEANSELFEFAWSNKVMLTSPSNLLAALKIIHNFYMVDKQNKNAQDIAVLAGKMYDKFAELLKDILGIEKNLNLAKIKLAGKDNLLNQVDRLKELGAKANKDLIKIEINDEEK